MSTQGKRISKIREKLNISQQELAVFFGFSRAYMSSIENEKIKSAKFELLQKNKTTAKIYLAVERYTK